MNIIINGKDHQIEKGKTISEIIEIYGLNPVNVIVEYNRKILKKEAIKTITPDDGDRIELIRVVGGG